MANVLSPPSAANATSPISPKSISQPFTHDSLTEQSNSRVRPVSRISNPARSARLSTLSRHTSSSRPQSTLFPAFSSSLDYASVRDFAYPLFHPLHYGPSPATASGATTPGSEWNSGRRLSDPLDAWNVGRGGTWGAGPWGGDGVMYSDPVGDDVEALPSTSFGEELDDESGIGYMRRSSKHRKSKSYTDISEHDRGRRHESGSLNRRSRAAGDGADFYTSSASPPPPHPGKLDPAGQGSLRQSRNYGYSRKDYPPNMLPSRSFHTGQLPEPDTDEDLLPLDAEQSFHAHSPQRASMGPDDELFAGESLALYAFEPENPNEMRLHEGQIILVSYRHGQGWLVAEDPATGEQGLVPEEYVRLVSEIQSWDHEKGQFIEEDSMMIDEASPAHASANGRLTVSTELGSNDSEAMTPIGRPIADESHESTPKQRRYPRQDHTIGQKVPPESQGPDTDEANAPKSKLNDALEGRQDSAHGDS